MSRIDAFWTGAKSLRLSAEQRERSLSRLAAHMNGERNSVVGCLRIHMNDAEHPFWEDAKHGELAPGRKDAVRGNLLAYMRERADAQPTGVRFVRLWKTMTASFAAVLSMAGVCAAAEVSVPGDLLYPLKINVNERAYALLSTTPEARALWHVRAAERRVREAQALEVRGGLTDETRKTVNDSVDVHAKAALKEAEAMPPARKDTVKLLRERLSTVIETPVLKPKEKPSPAVIRSMHSSSRAAKSADRASSPSSRKGPDLPLTVPHSLPDAASPSADITVPADDLLLASSKGRGPDKTPPVRKPAL